MRVLIFGSRDWDDPAPIRGVLIGIGRTNPLDPITVVEGEAPGADKLGRKVAEELGCYIDPFPADWAKYGRYDAGPIRNQQMLDSGIDLAYGFKDRFDWSMRKGGSEDMARRLTLASVPFYIVGRP